MPRHKELFHWQFEAFGTLWSIDTVVPVSAELREQVSDYIESFDKTYSRFRDDSLVTEMSNHSGTYVFPDSAIAIFELYEQLYQISSGKVTPLIGALLDHLGYDAKYSFHKKEDTISVPDLNVLQWNGSTVSIDQAVRIDIGAVGKGYVVDKIAELLGSEHDQYTVDASGDIRTKGDMGECIGLEDPFTPGKVLGSVLLRDNSLCGSATNRRRWGSDLHHIVDPHTLRSTHGVAAVWVMASSAAVADGATTALFFVDPERVRAKFNIEYICFYDDRSMRYSEGMKEFIA